MRKVLFVVIFSAFGCGFLQTTPQSIPTEPPPLVEALSVAEASCVYPDDSNGADEQGRKYYAIIGSYEKILKVYGESKEYFESHIRCSIILFRLHSVERSLDALDSGYPNAGPYRKFARVWYKLNKRYDRRMDRYGTKYCPWRQAQAELSVLKEKYPGKYLGLVENMERKIETAAEYDLKVAQQAQRDYENSVDMKDHRLLETFWGVEGVSDCQDAIETYERKGFKKVMWTIDKDDDDRMICELWGVPPRTKR